METVTLRAEDFRTVHNTLCELRNLVDRMTDSMIKIDDVQRIVQGFEAGLADAYAQDNEVFESKMDYYSQFREDNGLEAIWSIYELPVHGFLKQHPFPSDAFVVYTQHWGEGRKHYPVQGGSWGDLYRAADAAIRESGDDHHIFIEHFELKNGNELHLSTGS